MSRRYGPHASITRGSSVLTMAVGWQDLPALQFTFE
jgi:hypothetical protein